MQEVIAKMSGASKSFDKLKVLDQITIELKSGTILGLIGPSGAGKSTAIKCLI
ncbi:ATP-binding cassette domain-containing protein [Enterococcus olivae]